MAPDKAAVRPPTAIRVAGGIVIVASILSALLATAFASSPLHMNTTLAVTMLACLPIAGVGGIWLLALTRNWLWLLTLFPVIAVFGVWLSVAQMVPVTFH